MSIDKNLIIFIISLPKFSKRYSYYNLLTIPISNRTLVDIPLFLLSSRNNQWVTQEQCLELENLYFCKQNNIKPLSPCLKQIMKNHSFSECVFANTEIINDIIIPTSSEIILIPKTKLSLQNNCSLNLNIVEKPSILFTQNCSVQINNVTIVQPLREIKVSPLFDSVNIFNFQRNISLLLDLGEVHNLGTIKQFSVPHIQPVSIRKHDIVLYAIVTFIFLVILSYLLTKYYNKIPLTNCTKCKIKNQQEPQIKLEPFQKILQ